MLTAVRSAFTLPDLRTKLLITIGILVIYRLCAHIPLPGVNAAALDQLFTQDPNILLNMLNFFSGGALAQMGVMALGVYPYITSSIIMQLLVPMGAAVAGTEPGRRTRPSTNQQVHLLPDHPACHRVRRGPGDAAELVVWWGRADIHQLGLLRVPACCRP